MTKISQYPTDVGTLDGDELVLFVDDPEGTPASATGDVDDIKDYVLGEYVEPATLVVPCSNEDTAIEDTGIAVTFRMPFAMTVSQYRASLTTAASSGLFTVDIAQGGVSVLSTLITIDAGEDTSVTADAAPVISTPNLTDNAEITIIIDDVASSTATGLKVYFIGTVT